MKSLEIRGARTRLGFTQQYMADQLAISTASYSQKERGEVKFAISEAIKVKHILELSDEQFYDFFSDDKLPIGDVE